MKILEVTSGVKYGGAEKQAEALIFAARAAGDRVAVITGANAEFAAELRRKGVEDVTEIRVHKEMRPSVVGEFRALIKRFDPDVVNVHSPRPLTTLLFLKMIGYDFGLIASRRVTFPINGVSLRLKWGRRSLDHIIANTNIAATGLIAGGVSPEKVKVINSGSDLSKFEQLPDGAAFRQKIGVPESAKLIIKVANFYAWKGYLDFISIAERICETRSDVVFAAVGSDTEWSPEFRKLVSQSKAAAKIIIPGFQNDMSVVYSASDALVHCTLEGDGIAGSVREAAAAAKPVVCSTGGANSELIEHEKCGLLFKPGDVDAAAGHLLRMLDDREAAERMSAEAKDRVFKNFGMDVMIEKTRAVYRSVSEKRRG